MQPSSSSSKVNHSGQNLPFLAYEPTIEFRDRKSRAAFIQAHYNVQTGEAERIAVDWTAKGGEGGTSCKNIYTYALYTCNILLVESHLQTQKAAVKMLHDRILTLVQYVTEVLSGTSFVILLHK